MLSPEILPHSAEMNIGKSSGAYCEAVVPAAPASVKIHLERFPSVTGKEIFQFIPDQVPQNPVHAGVDISVFADEEFAAKSWGDQIGTLLSVIALQPAFQPIVVPEWSF